MITFSPFVPFLVVFAAATVAAVALATGVVVDFVARNRRQRLQAHQSVRTYYRSVALTH